MLAQDRRRWKRRSLRALGNREVISAFPPPQKHTAVTVDGFLPRWLVRRVSTVSVPGRRVRFALVLPDPAIHRRWKKTTRSSGSNPTDSIVAPTLGRRHYGVGMFRMRWSSDDINATARLKLLTQPCATAILE